MDRLLLLDLDGVTILEIGPPHKAGLEILTLHETLIEFLSNLRMPVIVLTHRSRAEANRILTAAALPSKMFFGVMAAEDLFFSALRHGQTFTMLKDGLRKSLIIPKLERQFGVSRRNMALIDDRIDNVDDMVSAGLGLILHAPSALQADGKSIITFDLNTALKSLDDWIPAQQPPQVIQLPQVIRPVETFPRTGHNTARDSRHTFNTARRLANAFRRLITRQV